MQQLKRCPIGIQTFSNIIEDGYLYVDKTEYVYKLAHGDAKYYFLSRPRRFGKSLLTSTLRSYFEGRRDLFKGLAIDALETEWTEYPVLHFDMSRAKHVDKETLESMLGFQLSQYEDVYGKSEGADKLNDRMTSLIIRANRQTGRKVVVLIDEYDAPLLDVMHEERDLPVLRNVMRNFYSPLKACDPYLRFVFLTGITKFSQLSIFSELNNISNISMLKPYAAICGITEEEMLGQMDGYISRLASKLGITHDEAVRKLKDAGITVVVHQILGLPGEGTEDMAATARYIGKSGADGIKFHLLHVLQHTDLAVDFDAGKFDVLTLEQYIAALEVCVQAIPREMVIHRLTGDGAKRDLVAPLWSGDKKRVLNAIHAAFARDDVEQGSSC